MKTDLDAAAELQASLLPTETSDVDGISFGWTFRPCDELAGDILGAFKLGGDRVGFYVADVSGHGVAAALLSVSISRMMDPTPSPSSLLFQQTPGSDHLQTTPPCDVIRELNRRFQIEECGGTFFSMVYGIVDPQTRNLQIASAGHPPVIRVSNDQVAVPLEAEGMLIGVIDDYEYEDCEVQLQSGDRLVAYSDGVVEQLDANDEEFSEARLANQLAETRPLSLDDAIKHLADSVVDWTEGGHLNDDLSILAMDLS